MSDLFIPTELRQKRATLFLARRAVLLHGRPREPSPRSTPLHTNYTTARSQIEVPFCTGCAWTTKRCR